MIRSGEKSQSEIAVLFNVDRSTISRMMTEVRKKDLAKGRLHDNGPRNQLVVLTAARCARRRQQNDDNSQLSRESHLIPFAVFRVGDRGYVLPSYEGQESRRCYCNGRNLVIVEVQSKRHPEHNDCLKQALEKHRFLLNSFGYPVHRK